VPARKLKYSREKLFGSGAFGREDFFDSIEGTVNEGASGDYLLTMGRSFAIVETLGHFFKYTLAEKQTPAFGFF